MTAWPRPALAVLGTFLGEECWGAPGPARAAAEQAAASAEDRVVRAGCLVDAALAALRAGEPRRAIGLIDGSGALALGGDVAALAAAYRNAAVLADINWVAGGFGSAALDGGPAMGSLDLVAVPACADPALALEVGLVGLEGTARSARTTIALEAAYGQPPQAGPLLTAEVQQLGQQALAAGFPIGAAWCSRLLADVLRLGGDPSASGWLGQAEALASGSPMASASIHLAAGDALAGLPESFGVDPARRPQPPPPPTVDAIAAARARYASAAELAAGAPWLLGVLSGRAAALAIAEGDLAAAEGHLADAEARLAGVGDEARVRAMRIERLVIGALQGEPQVDAAAVVDEVAAWARRDGSRSYGIGLVVVLVDRGRGAAGDGAAEPALALLELADRLQRGLGGEADRITLLTRLADVRASFGQRAAALAALEEAFALASRDLGDDAPPLGSDGWQTAAKAFEVSTQVFLQQIRDMDPEGMRTRADRLIAIGSRLTVGVDLHPVSMPDPHSAGSLEDLQRMAQQVIGLHAASVTDQARVMVPLYRAVRRREAGEPGADELFAEALATARTSLDGLLEPVVLGQQGDYAAAAPLMRAFLADAGWPDRDAFETLVTVMDWPAARESLDRIVAAEGPDWHARSLRPWEGPMLVAELLEGEGDLDGALALVEIAASRFEERSRGLARTAFRTALADDRMVRRLHVLGARVAGRLGNAAAAIGDHATARDHYATALRFAERGRSRALLDLIAARDGGAGEPEVRAWQSADAELASAYDVLADLWSRSAGAPAIADAEAAVVAAEVALADREAALVTTAPGALARLRSARAHPAGLDAVQRSLPPGVAALEYVFGDDRLQILAIRRDGATSQLVPFATSELRGLLARAHRACRAPDAVDRPEDEWSRLAPQLAALLLDPVAAVLAGAERVIVVPFGGLHAVPLHAVPFGPDGAPLGAHRVVSYLPSLGLLEGGVTLDRPCGAGPSLVVGDPASMAIAGRPAHPLDLAGLEATTIATRAESEALVGSAATERAVRDGIPGARVVHAATHGLVDGVAPMRSSILLANGESLTVTELLALELDADLVVFSACESGFGHVTAGDELLGLTRGLLAAGARRAVVSLWPVWDDLACVTMCRFHELLADGRPPAVALHDAQRELAAMTRADVRARLTDLASSAGAPEIGPVAAIRREVEPAGGERPPTGLDHPNAWAPFILVGA